MSTPVSWPLALQDFWNEANFGEDPGDVTVRSEMEDGPAKVRKKYTVAIDKFSGSLNITTAQYTTFKNFYDVSLNGGVKTFYFKHPITEVMSVFRFIPPYKVTSLGGGQFFLTFVWEKMP